MTRILLKFCLLAALYLAGCHSATSQTMAGGRPDPQLSQKDNDYLDRQAAVFLDTVSSILAKYPPALVPHRERNMAMMLLDAVYHEKFAAFRKPGQQFFLNQASKAIGGMEQSRVEKGARIWKIYDMGFIARTASVTIAFDLVSGATSGSPEFALPGRELDRLVKQCDVLFISHRHADHAEKAVVQKFLDAGKPVVAPLQLWPGDSLSSRMLHPERNADKQHTLKLANGRSLVFTIFPGHQMQSTDNNVVLVTTPEGINLAHLGDQINEGDFMTDFEWIDKVSTRHRVDILMPDCWTMDIVRIVKGFNPSLVLPGHEIELGHTVWDRVPYWGDDQYLELNYRELKKSKFPVVVMAWGESITWKPEK